MNKWWKSPVLQGPENDYGDYDYLINLLPRNSANWNMSKYKWKCDECGHESHLLFCTEQYFYTIDGYDSMSWNCCWKCRLKDFIRGKVWKIKMKIKVLRTAFALYHETKNISFTKCYQISLKLER